MKQLFLTILYILILSTGSSAQQRRPGERIHAAKVAYITDRLQLTADQAMRFWPVYDEYEAQVKSIRQQFRRKYNNDNASETDNQAYQYIDDNLDYQEQIIQLKRNYNQQFLKILSPEQVADLYKAERAFRQLLIQQLKERRNNGGGWNR